MAARRRVAVVGVTHFNKGDGSAINKIIGSIAFVAAARCAWMIAIDPDDENRRLFVNIKNNVGRAAPPLAFRLAQTMVGEEQDIVAPYVVWDSDPVADTTADQVLAAAKGGDRPANVDAADLLMSLLDMGPMLVRAIEDEAVAAGLLKAGVSNRKGQGIPARACKAWHLQGERNGLPRRWHWLGRPMVLAAPRR